MKNLLIRSSFTLLLIANVAIAADALPSSTVDALVKKLQVMIPDLLDVNGCADTDDVPFKMLSECTAVTHAVLKQADLPKQF